MGSMRLPPSNILFSQDSIRGEFSDGTPLTETLRDILHGHVSIENDLRPLSVVMHEFKYYVISGNRRLFIYKILQDNGIIKTVPVNVRQKNLERFKEMYTTTTGGKSISARRDKYPGEMKQTLRTIIQNWKQSSGGRLSTASQKRSHTLSYTGQRQHNRPRIQTNTTNRSSGYGFQESRPHQAEQAVNNDIPGWVVFGGIIAAGVLLISSLFSRN